MRDTLTAAAGALALGIALTTPAWAQQKPPTQYINLGDVRRLAAACDDWAGTLREAARQLEAGAISADDGRKVEAVKDRVQPICEAQTSTEAGKNLQPVVLGVLEVEQLLK